MNTSKFNLWRACFSFCRVDGKIAPSEEKWIKEKIKQLGFSDEQKIQLTNELHSPRIPTSDILPLITKPADRSFLTLQLNVLANIDGIVSSEEKLKIKETIESIKSQIDYNELENNLQKEKINLNNETHFRVNNEHSMFELIHRKLEKFLSSSES